MSRFRASALARHHAVDLVRRGATFKAAGEAVGVSDFAVRRWCRADGVASVRGRGGDRAGVAGTVADAEDVARVAGAPGRVGRRGTAGTTAGSPGADDVPAAAEADHHDVPLSGSTSAAVAGMRAGAPSPVPQAPLVPRPPLAAADSAAGGRPAEGEAEDAGVTETGRLRSELVALEARLAAAERRAAATEKRAAVAEQRMHALLAAHPR